MRQMLELKKEHFFHIKNKEPNSLCRKYKYINLYKM